MALTQQDALQGNFSPQVILFDMDGTLINTGELILQSFAYTVETVLGIKAPDDELSAAVGTPLISQMERIARAHVTNQHTRSTEALYHHHEEAEIGDSEMGEMLELRTKLMDVYTEKCANLHDYLIKQYDGVEEMLMRFTEAGIPLGVVTSKRRAQAIPDLAHFGLDRYFQKVTCADDLEHHKPDPRPLLYTLNCINESNGTEVRPMDCAYIGDSPFDLLASKRAGMHTVAVTWGLFDRNILLAEKPDRVVNQPAELLYLIPEHNQA